MIAKVKRAYSGYLLPLIRHFHDRDRRHFVLRRIAARLQEPRRSVSRKTSTAWCDRQCEKWQDWANSLDPYLYEESRSFCHDVKNTERRLGAYQENFVGGGANYGLIYFLVRRFELQSIVETGVASGYSTFAILAAIEKNGNGELYSSDFPYLAADGNHDYLGALVPENLKDNWSLVLGSDRYAVPKILSNMKSVDFLCYDSDKSYSGRKFVVQLIDKLASDKYVLLMDDIQDNLFFKDYVEDNDLTYRVFEFDGKYMGLTTGMGHRPLI